MRTRGALFNAVLFLFVAGLAGQFGLAQRLVSRFGSAQVNGRDVIVHVTVVVPPGVDGNRLAEEALRNQGARPFAVDAFATSGLVWDQFSDADAGNDFVTQNYNPADDPTGVGDQALLNTQGTWTDVVTSSFALFDGGLTSRCPSLVRECKGPQEFDGFNDVGWVSIGGCCTLAVTWFSTSVDEADMGINTRFSWATDGVNDFDLETVVLHENGHVLGLGHSDIQAAVMFASYQEVRRQLHSDDIDGVSFLYPADGTTGSISGTVTDSSTGGAIAGAEVTVDGTGRSGTTDGSGNYSIGSVPEGTHSATATASGFDPQTVTGVVVTADTDTSGVNFALDPAPAGSSVTVDSISYSTEGGRLGDKHLSVTVSLVDDLGQAVAGATVSISLTRDGGVVGTGTGTTGSHGTVTFTLKNAASGCYETTVTDVNASGLTWDGATPPNQFCK